MVAEVTKPYDPETQTVSYIAYWGQSGYFETPIVCNNVVGSAGANMKTGMRTQVVGNIVLIDGVIHFEEGATLKACATLNTSSGRYAAGLQVQMVGCRSTTFGPVVEYDILLGECHRSLCHGFVSVKYALWPMLFGCDGVVIG